MGRSGIGQSLTAQALYFTAPSQVSVREEPLPSLAPGQVLVRTIVSAISPGTELLIYRGQAPTDIALDESIAALTGDFSFPLRYGYAAVGRVVAVASTAEEAWQDRLVFAFQPHASHFTKRRVRLLRSGCVNTRAYAALLRAGLQCGASRLPLSRLPSFTDELVERWHEFPL